MQPEGRRFIAIRDIDFNGVRAYNTGDWVGESAVDGPGAWLELGVDVEPLPGVRLSMPARNAPQAAWAAYAASTGAGADEAAGMSRAALIAAYGPDSAAHTGTPDTPAAKPPGGGAITGGLAP